MPGIALAVTAAVLAGLVNLALLRVWPRPNVGGHVAMFVYASIVGITAASVGGYYSPNIGWLYTIPLCAAVVVGQRGSLFWTAITTLMLVGFWELPNLGIHLPNHIPPEARHANALFTRLLALISVAVLGATFVAGQRRAERELARTSEERRREKAYVELIMHAAVSANEASSFEDALQESLERIANAMGWIGGHVCTVRDDGYLVSSGIFHVDEPERFQALLDVTLNKAWPPGQGIAGRALMNRRPEFVGELEENDPQGRAALANSLGFSSAFAVPIFVNGEIPVVMEFVSADPLPDIEDLTRVFSHIGVQLGRVAERSAMQDRLRQAQKLEAVGQLAAGIAHEINNPMSYVRSNLHTLRSEWDGIAAKLREGERTDPASSHRIDECQELIDESLEGVERTIAIVRDMREFSHSGGALASQRERVDLSELLTGALRVASAQAPGGVVFTDELTAGLWTICAAGQLQQVFVNLVVNAIHAVGEHGHIKITSGRRGDEVFVRIEDDGTGMSATTRERLFDPFFTTKPVNEGTGLGLSVSYEIIRSHHGRIEVTSEPGEGASFEIRLPAASARS
jgi:signal transduction histidine kinase